MSFIFVTQLPITLLSVLFYLIRSEIEHIHRDVDSFQQVCFAASRSFLLASIYTYSPHLLANLRVQSCLSHDLLRFLYLMLTSCHSGTLWFSKTCTLVNKSTVRARSNQYRSIVCIIYMYLHSFPQFLFIRHQRPF